MTAVATAIAGAISGAIVPADIAAAAGVITVALAIPVAALVMVPRYGVRVLNWVRDAVGL